MRGGLAAAFGGLYNHIARSVGYEIFGENPVEELGET
jgi:hypothetical protein